jgi:hypothetical protein
MHILEVGKPYVQGVTKWPEASEYLYSVNGHELRLFYNSPSIAEIEGAKSGKAEFALYVQLPVIIFLHKIAPAHDWADCPYTFWRVPDTHRQSPDLASRTPESRALLQITLVNARTGILKALRATTLSVEMTQKLEEAIAAQATMAYTHSYFDEAVQRAQSIYTPAQMAHYSVVRCQGGA